MSNPVIDRQLKELNRAVTNKGLRLRYKVEEVGRNERSRRYTYKLSIMTTPDTPVLVGEGEAPVIAGMLLAIRTHIKAQQDEVRR